MLPFTIALLVVNRQNCLYKICNKSSKNYDNRPHCRTIPSEWHLYLDHFTWCLTCTVIVTYLLLLHN